MQDANMILIRYPQRWTEEDGKSILDRAARIVSVRQTEALPQTGGYAYSLDESTNNWWGDVDHASRAVKIVYRYHHGHEEELRALETLLVWLFGVEKENTVARVA